MITSSTVAMFIVYIMQILKWYLYLQFTGRDPVTKYIDKYNNYVHDFVNARLKSKCNTIRNGLFHVVHSILFFNSSGKKKMSSLKNH